MSERATCWSVTINNPIPADDDNIARAKQKSGWKIDGQLEQGENGTKHYQLILKTPQVRFSAIKSAFPRAHIEIARNSKALAKYVTKEETRIGTIPNENDKFPTMERFWELFYSFYKTVKNNIDFEGIETPDKRLQLLDDFVGWQIQQGSFVESFGVNPQIRSSAKKYLINIFRRSEIIHRQKTDRQTKLISEDEIITENGDEESYDENETQTTSSETTISFSSQTTF
jgi:hypothetical protein